MSHPLSYIFIIDYCLPSLIGSYAPEKQHRDQEDQSCHSKWKVQVFGYQRQWAICSPAYNTHTCTHQNRKYIKIKNKKALPRSNPISL